jgi:general control protein GCN4
VLTSLRAAVLRTIFYLIPGFPPSGILSDSSFHPPKLTTHTNKNIADNAQDVLNTVIPTNLTTSVIIPSQLQQQNQPHSPHPPNHSAFPFPENLTSSTASSFSFSPQTANIPSQEFNLFTTDSQPPWLPSSSSSLPAQSPRQHQHPLSHQDHSDPNSQALPTQDFVLFERSPSARSTPSVSNNQAITGQHRRHSSTLTSASSLQNQRVAAIIQSTGHSISTSALTNRFNPAQSPQQFYASSAPSSTTQLQQQRQTRPQVPLFSQSTGNIPQTPNMAMQGNSPGSSSTWSRDSQNADMDLFDDEFTAFEGGASTGNMFSSAYSSPAVPTIYDPNMNLSSSSSTNMGTVSPQDLLVRDTFASAPNSTAFTNLTSPSTYNESPEYTDNFDVSPFIGNNGDLDQALSGDPWYPLFPQDDQTEQSQADASPLLPEEELEVSEHLRTSSGRRRSGTGASSPTGTHASVSGVNSRKRDKPLPPIIVEDPNDTVAMKRARNTLAARKSRQRKMQRFEELEDKIAKLEAERDHWKNIALRRTGGQP